MTFYLKIFPEQRHQLINLMRLSDLYGSISDSSLYFFKKLKIFNGKKSMLIMTLYIQNLSLQQIFVSSCPRCMETLYVDVAILKDNLQPIVVKVSVSFMYWK